MNITISVPPDIEMDFKKLPDAHQFAVEALREKIKGCRKNDIQQKKRDEAFQALLDFIPMDSMELSEDTVRKEREKRDSRNLKVQQWINIF